MASRSGYPLPVVTQVWNCRFFAGLAACFGVWLAGCGFSVDQPSPDLGDDASAGSHPDLSSSVADLLGVDFSGVDLSGVDLTSPPASPKRLFVTHDAYSGSMTASQGGSPGLLGGDSLCTNLANGAHIGGIWRAWLSDANNDAIDRITGAGPWKRMDGQVAFADRAALLVGPAVPINLDQTNTRVPINSGVWTGTAANGRYASKTTLGKGNCDDWTNSSSTGQPSGEVGDTETLDGGWTDIADHECFVGARLYCFEQ